MLIGDLFERDVTRAIPPVVYFHEQEPGELQREVEEYIITGGYPEKDPRATEGGIHEQFVRLLTAMRRELDAPGGPRNPACWISGMYGSGKSSFAKLLGLALDGRKLPDGRALADALLAQDHSPDSVHFKLAWDKLLSGLQPIAVVFDVGSKARDGEQIHAVAVRELQHRLGYSKTSNLVAEYELKLEIEGLHGAFLDKVAALHGRPWTELKDSQLSEDYFSAAIHALKPELFPDPMSWVDSRSGSAFESKRSADEAVVAIQRMVEHRCPGRTLFLVVDEVSQYVHDDDGRMLALQSFVEALGQRMKGKAWLLATGQQKLEQEAGAATAIVKLKDRFPPSLRVHLGTASIREVVHKRLLRKRRSIEGDLESRFRKNRPDLDLYAYRGNEISETDFVEVYPMLPGHVDLLLDITSGLRSRSGGRAQGDSHAIRGLLQLLGDLFRDKDLARFEVGRLVTIDLVYEVLHSALSSDVQSTLVRALDLCAHKGDDVMARVVKAVALLELMQKRQSVSAELIARCLYTYLGQGNQQPAIQRALDELVKESLVGFSEKDGYKIESSAAQEWQRDRDEYVPGLDQQSVEVQNALSFLVADVEKLKLSGVDVPWLVLFSDNLGAKDVRLKDERKPMVVKVDFLFAKGQGADVWIPLTSTEPYKHQFVWVVGEVDNVRHVATKLLRASRMIERYGTRQLPQHDDKANLLSDERHRRDAAAAELKEAVKSAFLAGQIYFRGRPTSARDVGTTFTAALTAYGNRVVNELYPSPTVFSVAEKDMLYLIESTDLAAPPAVLGQDKLGILSLDAGRYEVTCAGRVPTDLLAHLRAEPGVTGAGVLAHFGGPPHGVAPDVLRAAVIGLLRAHKLRVDLPGVGELTSVRDEGVRELLKDATFRKARLFENTKDPLAPRDRNAICTLFKDMLDVEVARDNDAIADAVAARFTRVRERLTALGERLRKLPPGTDYPEALTQLESALEACRRSRQVEPTVTAVKRALPALRDGLALLRRMETDLTEASVTVLRDASNTLAYHWPPLEALGPSEEVREATRAIQAHLATPRPWEDTADLGRHVEAVRAAYRERRGALLDAHAERVDNAVERIKRRDGFERLDMDQRHQVLRALREGAAASTDAQAVVPALEALEGQLAARREAAESKAMAHLDAFLEKLGERPTVELTLDLAGREIKTEADMDQLLAELRRKILHELSAHHRVRIR